MKKAAASAAAAAFAMAAAEDPGDDPAAARNMEACGCNGRAGCEACGGCGWRRRAAESVEIPEGVGEFLEDRGFVARHGLDAWMRINGMPDAWFLEAMRVYDAEVDRIVHERRAAMAADARKRGR